MHGNVWEWVQDSYEADYGEVSTDGSAHGSLDDRGAARVLRGGAWFNGPRRLRSAFRDRASPDYRHNFIGFRLARMLA